MSSAVAQIYQVSSNSNVYLPIVANRYNEDKRQGQNDSANRLTLKLLKEQLKDNKKVAWELRNLVNCFAPDEDWEVIRRESLKLIRQGNDLPENSLISFRCVYQGIEDYYDIPVNRLPRYMLIEAIKVSEMVQPNFQHNRKKIKKEKQSKKDYFPKSNNSKNKGKKNKGDSAYYQLRALNFW